MNLFNLKAKLTVAVFIIIIFIGLNNFCFANVFFHQTLSQSWFFSIDAGYHYNTLTTYDSLGTKNVAVMTSIPITVGINTFLDSLGIRPYLGFEVGLLNRKVGINAFLDLLGIHLYLGSEIGLLNRKDDNPIYIYINEYDSLGTKKVAVMTSIPIIEGINAFLDLLGIRSYLGLGFEIGLLNRKDDNPNLYK